MLKQCVPVTLPEVLVIYGASYCNGYSTKIPSQ